MIPQSSSSTGMVSLAFALVLMAVSVPACSKSTTETCSSGRVCPSGWACSADGQACINSSCGDGDIQEGEACDDGNLQSGDGCNSTCTSNEQCGNAVIDPDEACDDGNTVSGDDCSFDCKHSAECGNRTVDAREECDPPGDRAGFRCSQNCLVAFCGNKRIDENEECDDGNSSNEDACLVTCKRNHCGDGHLYTGKEACDDGNRVTESGCPYGTKDCTVCNDNCSQEITVRGSFCGDGKQDPSEACDSGSANGTKKCPYGSETCDVCNASCTATEKGTGVYCGDGKLNHASEECDFGRACGVCTGQCRRILSAYSQGSIEVLDYTQITDETIIVLNDVKNRPLTLYFKTNCDIWPLCMQDKHHQRYCCVELHSVADNSQVASAIEQLISDVKDRGWLAMSAEAQSTQILLTHNTQGTRGNQPIFTTANPEALKVKGMSGGIGFDCPVNTPCIIDSGKSADCAHGLECSEGFCKPK